VRRAHRALWLAGAPARAFLIGAIRVYRIVLSGWLGGQCRYVPSCSRYSEAAIRTHGVMRGGILAAWRVARCNPFGKGGIEPVPPSRGGRQYDRVILDRSRAET
jgi:putative membrane protein insertion efficiency factor